MKTALLITVTLLLFQIGCGGSKPENTRFSQIPDSVFHEPLAVFIEHDKPDDPGNLVLFSLSTHRKYYLTDDSFQKLSPVLSVDRASVAFISARIGDANELKALGSSVRRQIYSLSLRTGELDRLDAVPGEKPSRGHFFYSSIDWLDEGRHLCNVELIPSIEGFRPHSDSAWEITTFPQDTSVSDIEVSPDGKWIACGYLLGSTPFYSGILLYNRLNGSTVDIVHGRRSCILGGWSSDSRLFGYGSSAVSEPGAQVFDTESHLSENIAVATQRDSIFEGAPFFVSQDQIIMLAAHRTHRPKGFPQAEGTDLATYNLRNKSFEWLTTDRRFKDGLRFYAIRSSK